jgi:putative transposase
VVEYIHDHYGVAWRRACRLMQMPRSGFYYKSVLNPRLELRNRLRELARVRMRFGSNRSLNDVLPPAPAPG